MKNRSSNFELLRLFCMLMIIFFHYSDHGIVNIYNVPFSINRLALEFALIGGGLGNCVFILLTGYFLSESKFEYKKIVKLYCQVFFYSIFLGILCFLMGDVAFNYKNLSDFLFPITHDQYWWFSQYFILYLIFPFINKVINNSSKREMIFLIMLLFICDTVLPTAFNQNQFTNNLMTFVMLYLIGAFIKKYEILIFNKLKIIIPSFVIVLLLCLFSILIMDKKDLIVSNYVWPMNRTPILILSILTFLLFKNIKISNNKFINAVAKTTFGIYLIHMHKYFYLIFWKYMFDNSILFNNWLFIPAMIIQCIIVFSICALIEYKRNDFFEQYILPPIYKLIDKMKQNRIFRLIKKSI